MYAVIRSRRGSTTVIPKLRQILVAGKSIPLDQFSFDPYSAVLYQFIGLEDSYSIASDTIESVRIHEGDDIQAITKFELFKD